ncbi:MAG: hypothetical protein K9K79_07465 [Desulfohalobiaceae bacterium]|nr:hypothetical protein [Desulfohalobiaceae bacterium]
MIKNRPLALLMLFLVLIILGHSVISLFQGKFQQAMIMTPLLIIIYVFGLAKKDGSAPDQDREKSPSKTKSEDDSEK